MACGEYIPLSDVIDLSGLDYLTTTYHRQEMELLQPRLEAQGYDVLGWFSGEMDSFGPLSRLCRAIDSDGEVVTFIYG